MSKLCLTLALGWVGRVKLKANTLSSDEKTWLGSAICHGKYTLTNASRKFGLSTSTLYDYVKAVRIDIKKNSVNGRPSKVSTRSLLAYHEYCTTDRVSKTTKQCTDKLNELQLPKKTTLQEEKVLIHTNHFLIALSFVMTKK